MLTYAHSMARRLSGFEAGVNAIAKVAASTPRQIIRKIISMQSTPHRPFITTALSIDTAGKISDEPKSCRWVGM